MKTDLKSIIFGLIFMVMGLFFMFIFGQITDLSCTRNSDGRAACRTEVQFLGVFTLSTREFKDVYRADVEESCDDEGCNYRVVLTTLEGEQPLTSYFTSSWTGKEKTATQINDFIQSSSNRGTLSIQENSGLWASLFSLVFVLVGIYQVIVQGLIKPNQLFNE